MNLPYEFIMKLSHWYSEDYLLHLANITSSERFTFKVNDFYINFFVKTGSHGEVINSNPFFGSHGGFYQSNYSLDAVNTDVDDLYSWLNNRNLCSLTLVENPYASPDEKMLNHELVSKLSSNHSLKHQEIKRFCSIAELEQISGQDDLLKSFHQKHRNAIRKYFKSGSEIKEISAEDRDFLSALDNLSTLHSQSILGKGGTAKGSTYFSSIMQYFESQRIQLLQSVLNGKVEAALLNFKIDNQIEYWTPVATEIGRQHNMIHGLINHAMLQICGKKNSRFNFGGSWSEQRDLLRFKNRFGSTSFSYKYDCFVSNSAILDVDPVEISNEYKFFFVRQF